MISGFGAAGIVGLIAYALLIGLMADRRIRQQLSMVLIDLPALQPPPPPTPTPKVEPRKKTPAAKRSPSPRNLKNKATEVVAPPPVIRLPVPQPVVTAPKAGPGTGPSTGASNRPGPGQGAGGIGNGDGGGGDGGDGDGEDTPPEWIRGELDYADLPDGLRAAGLRASVGVRYSVETNGRVGTCSITASSGNAELDRLTCALIQRRFPFDPSRDPDGRPVRSIIVERHSWEVDRDEDRRR